MNTFIAKIQRFGKIRQLHTIISQEAIKPSSPTPPHLRIHNLSRNDLLFPNKHVPFIFFYQNYNINGGINILKKSLSQSLTQYYPLAGRFLTPSMTCVDCIDQGVEFLEVSIDTRLDDFIHQIENNKILAQLTPNSFIDAIDQVTSQPIVAVQLNYFTCGGAALVVSISHKLADVFTTVQFINHWATVTLGGSPVNPTFFTSSITLPATVELPIKKAIETTYETKKFVFPNTKLNELKNKIQTMSGKALNPSRVESLTSIIFRCAMRASITKSGSLEPLTLSHTVDLRKNMSTDFPKIAAGNILGMAIIKVMDPSVIKLNDVVTILRKEVMEVRGIRDLDEAAKVLENKFSGLKNDRLYSFSSVCRFPFYQVDFGWGKPVRATVLFGLWDINGIVFMATPCGDGIEATVHLEKEEMNIFKKDTELLEYAESI